MAEPRRGLTAVSLGFALEPLSIALDQILPSRKIPAGLDISRKFKQIRRRPRHRRCKPVIVRKFLREQLADFLS